MYELAHIPDRRAWRRMVVLALALTLGLALLPLQRAAATPIVPQDLSGALAPADLVSALVGPGVTTSNVTYVGPDTAAGAFTGGNPAIGFDSGIILSSGNVATVVGPNDDDAATTSYNSPGDADLTALAGVSTNDAAVLEFDFVPDADTVFFSYVFSSEEYNEFARSAFNDVFGFFVNGENCATVGDPPLPVSINTINNGNPHGTLPNSHPELYINNDLTDGGGAIDTQMDGLTVVLTCTALVTSGATNHMKLAIADGSDTILDSNVFLQAGSFSTTPPSPCGPMDVAFVVDDTGSMGGALGNVQAEAATILGQIDTASGGDDQLALVSFKDNVTVLSDLALSNEASVSAGIAGLAAGGGGNLPEASDEALNTVINGLAAADRAAGQQSGDFDGAFRATAVKIIILVTDALPGGFDDTFTAGVDDVNAHNRALEALAGDILISAVYVPTGGVNAGEVAVMTDYATTTGGSFVQTNADGTGTADAISEIVENCGEPINTPPTVDAGGPYSGDEGAAVSVTGTADDADGDTLTTTWSYAPVSGVDAGATCAIADAAALATTVTCTDDGVYDLTLMVDDGLGGTATSTVALTVANVDPTGTITAPADASILAVNTSVTLTSLFTDPGSNDTHVCAVDWDDGSTPTGSGGLACTDTHSYALAGIYTVTAQVTDDDGGVGSDSIMLIVYDPAGGFVTGGGWIDSPAGAYTPDPTLTGRATFGFVSKYKKGATVPDGNTEFQFHAASFNFHSSAYEWLVVTKASKNAQFKGTGTVNGGLDPNGNPYKFMLWATDTSPDTFRIRIWYEDGGEQVVYDNGVEQALGSGSIVVHTK